MVEFGDFLSQKSRQTDLSLSLRMSRPKLALSAQVVRPGCGNKTIFCPALIGCFRQEMTSPDDLSVCTRTFDDW